MARKVPSGIHEVDLPATGMLDLLRREFGSKGLKRILDELDAQEVAARVSARRGIALSAKPAEGVGRFEVQYTEAVAALTAFGIETTGVPSLEQAMGNLSLNKLRSVTHLRQPTLVLVPPLFRHQMVKIIDEQIGNIRNGEYHVPWHTYRLVCDIHTYNHLSDDALWNNGKKEKNLTWEVSIVEGLTDVPVNEALQKPGGRFIGNHAQVQALLKDLKAKGLEPLSGARRYLSAMMPALVAGRPFDVKGLTVLNAEMITEDELSMLGCARWRFHRIDFDFHYQCRLNFHLSLRGVVRLI